MSSSAWLDRLRSTYGGPLDPTAQPAAVDVEPETWSDAVRTARDVLGCSFFDWLSAVDLGPTSVGEGAPRLQVVCHLLAHRPGRVDHVVLRTELPTTTPGGPELASVGDLYAGARWHERETHEMFGIAFTTAGEPVNVEPLLLSPDFEGHPLRKDFVLASRVVTTWPGAKEPGESDSTPTPTRSRRRARPLGVPEPGTWGPGQPPRSAGS